MNDSLDLPFLGQEMRWSVLHMSVSTQICWTQAWGGEALSLLRRVAGSLGLVVKELRSQKWDAATATIDGIRDVALSYVGKGGKEWSFLHLPLNADFSDAFAINLSSAQAGVVVEFHEYHDTCWGYRLVREGNVLDYFVNMPDVIEEEPGRCFGSPDLFSKVLNVSQNMVSPYLCHLSLDYDSSTKAHPDDEYPLSNHWVRVDFMRRLGIQYLDPNAGKGTYFYIGHRESIQGRG